MYQQEQETKFVHEEEEQSLYVYQDDDEYIDSSELSDEIFRSVEVFSEDDEYLAFEDPIVAKNADYCEQNQSGPIRGLQCKLEAINRGKCMQMR